MKPNDAGPRKSKPRRAHPALWNSPLPMEWMDPMSWRLPSGKALAEFALQAGFLAPLMLGMPGSKRRKTGSGPVVVPGKVMGSPSEEGPDTSGTFRETR